MLTNFEMVKEFHRAFDKNKMPEAPELQEVSIQELRMKLIMEELEEVIEALDHEDVVNLAKELADLLYVVYGMADQYGIPIDACFKAVHDSNMTKLGTDGKPVYRDDGKVIKGPNYQPPDLEAILKGEHIATSPEEQAT